MTDDSDASKTAGVPPLTSVVLDSAKPAYGCAVCFLCSAVVSIDQLEEILVSPTFGDSSDGPAVRAFSCHTCEDEAETR